MAALQALEVHCGRRLEVKRLHLFELYNEDILVVCGMCQSVSLCVCVCVCVLCVCVCVCVCLYFPTPLWIWCVVWVWLQGVPRDGDLKSGGYLLLARMCVCVCV